MASCTIARWLKETLRLAGSDVSIFSGYSVRGASTSAAAVAGVIMNDMQAADWSYESVFQKFYYRPSHDTTYGRTVLPSSSNETWTSVCYMSCHGIWVARLHMLCWATNNTIDMRNWAFWNVITKWLRSQSDHMLFGIIWRRWSRAYQWSHPPLPTHINRFANSKVEGAKTWWLFIGQFLRVRTVAICLFVYSQVLVVTSYYYYPCLYDNQR